MDHDHIPDDRVSNLEEIVAKLQARDIENQTKLDSLIASMAQLLQTKPTPETPLPTERHVISSPTDPPRTRMARPAAPPDFDGDRTKGMALGLGYF